MVVGETFIWRNLVHNIITFVHLDMKDILNSDDLHLLVEDFYRKLLLDKSINYIFTDVVKIKLEEHLPILVTFWSQAIFNTWDILII